MKKIYLLTLGLIGMAAVTFAQSEKAFKGTNVSVTPRTISLDHYSNSNNSQRATQVCIDTNLWTLARSFGSQGATYALVGMDNTTGGILSFGTFVDVPTGTSVTVTGFEFLARSIRADFADVTVTAKIYNAGADSLPTGVALASVQVSVDTATTWYRTATFTVPAMASGSFVMTLENSSAMADSMDILVGAPGSGIPDNQPAVMQQDGQSAGNYFRPANVFGQVLPHFYPFVVFSQSSTFSMSVSQLTSANESVDFAYSAYSMQTSPIWTSNPFFGDVSTHYSVDGGSTFSSSVTGDTSIIFADETVDHNIVMNDSLHMWSNGTCVITETNTLLKAGPNGINDVDANELKAYFANGELNIINGNGEATLYNITGRMVKQFTLTNQFETVDVSGLSEGVYILRVGNSVTKLKF